MDARRLYFVYLATALPTVIVSWYLGFPRGYLAPFIALPIGCIALNYFNDELVKERRVWKEYVISMLGLIVVIFIGYFHGSGTYLTLNDLYYLLVGTTVFEIGVIPLYYVFDFDVDYHSNRSISAWIIATSFMMVVSYVLFIVMDIRVVH